MATQTINYANEVRTQAGIILQFSSPQEKKEWVKWSNSVKKGTFKGTWMDWLKPTETETETKVKAEVEVEVMEVKDEVSVEPLTLSEEELEAFRASGIRVTMPKSKSRVPVKDEPPVEYPEKEKDSNPEEKSEGDKVEVEIDPEELNESSLSSAEEEVLKALPKEWQELYELVNGQLKYSSTWGLLCKQLITNSRWFQEGVSIINNSASLGCFLDKRKSFLVHMDTLPQEVKTQIEYPKEGSKNWQEYLAAKNRLKDLLNEMLQAILAEGKVYKHGDEVLNFYGVTVSNESYNQPLTLKEWKIFPATLKDDGVEVQLVFELSIKSLWKKIRGYGLKATLVDDVPFEITLKHEDEVVKDFVVMHSMSGLKGRPADLVGFANFIGGAKLDIVNGSITPLVGPMANRSFDLTVRNSVVDQWRNAMTKDCTMSLLYSRSEWEFIKEVDAANGYTVGSKGYDVISVEPEGPDAVRLTVKVQVLEVTLPLNIEVSLPEESSGKATLTPEMLSVMKLQNRIVGEGIESLGAQNRKAIRAMSDMFLNQIPEDVPTINIQSLKELANLKAYLGDTDLGSKSDADVLALYRRKYRNGVVFVSYGKDGEKSAHRQFFSFSTIGKIATFLGGSGKAVTGEVINFLRWLPTQSGISGFESKLHSSFALICRSMKAWIRVQMESRSLRKKLVGSFQGSAVGSKIRTLALPELSHVGTCPNAVPKVGINPKDEVLEAIATCPFKKRIPLEFLKEVPLTYPGKAHLYTVEKQDCKGTLQKRIPTRKPISKGWVKKSKWVLNPKSLNGKKVSLFRTPMPMQGACEIVITDNVAVGHFATLMHVWAMINEGDSDGDGVGLVPLFHYWDRAGLSDDEQTQAALSMNNHLLGMAGYPLAYGLNKSDWPCSEFFSFGDSLVKKVLRVTDEAVYDKLEQKGILPYVRRIPFAEWTQTTQNVSRHMRGTVGTTYNIAVIAVNESLNLQYFIWNLEAAKDLSSVQLKQLDQARYSLDLNMKCCAIAWRTIYEGLGLAGHTRDADLFMALFNMSPWIAEYAWEQNDAVNGMPCFPQKDTPESCKHSFNDLMYLGQQKNGKFVGGFSHLQEAGLIANLLRKYAGILADIKSLESPISDGRKKRNMEVKANKVRYYNALRLRTLRLNSQGIDWGMAELFASRYSEEQQDFSMDDEISVSGISPMEEFKRLNVALTIQDKGLAAIQTEAVDFHVTTQRFLAALEAAEEQEYNQA